ncbi:GNAT family N-acetyltransferase [Entomohabitans teleogrylli]|uniref:GNAT family N-acetyltransferase n=1 Tax=Entomohabitans teleogrylli TaxID=1384589 RepID=UPI00073D90C4|nr:GNAT family N-acetyltransferase [Entomohabitans teleogrylli]
MHVRTLTLNDRSLWLPLWQQYLDFYRHALPPDVTEEVFTRLCAGDALVGLVAERDGQLLGLMNLVFHPSTWSRSGYCYVEDLLVTPAARRQGVAKALFEHAWQLADQRQCDRVYWFTEEHNDSARALYDTLGQRAPFVIYRRQFV